MTRRPPISTLFPYPPLFRSRDSLPAETRREEGADFVDHELSSHVHGHDLLAARELPSEMGSRGRISHQHALMLLDVARTPRHADRKSTRLNSSHLVISYAVF